MRWSTPGQNSGRETCVADAAAVLAQSEVVGVEIGEFEAVVEDTKTDEQSATALR